MTGRYRWVVLSICVVAQAALASYVMGLPAIGPAIQAQFHLDLVRTGVLLTSVRMGMTISILSWGLAADRFGERLTLFIGLGGASFALLSAAVAPGYYTLLGALLAAGMLGSVVSSACGSAVMAWFGVRELGTALGIWQMAVPLGAAAASVALPAVLFEFGLAGCLVALAAYTGLAGAASAIWVRAAPRVEESTRKASGPSPLRDRRMWRLAVGGTLMVAGQVSLVTYLTTFLSHNRGMALSPAATVLAAVQLSGAGGLVGFGRLSDQHGHRVELLRLVALLSGLGLISIGLLVDGPLSILIGVVIAVGFFSVVSNGLVFSIAGELANSARVATALGIQGTLATAAGVVGPLCFAGLVSATSWRWGYVFAGVSVLIAWWWLQPLVIQRRQVWAATDA